MISLIDQFAVEQPDLARRMRELAVQFNYPQLLLWLEAAAKA